MIGWGQAALSLDQPVSPPASELYLYTISSWPDCADLRRDYSRLLSFQFVHGKLVHSKYSSYKQSNPLSTAGAMHLIGNSLGLLTYGKFVRDASVVGLLAYIHNDSSHYLYHRDPI
jgi:membrane associated rhomboid family serine protease